MKDWFWEILVDKNNPNIVCEKEDRVFYDNLKPLWTYSVSYHLWFVKRVGGIVVRIAASQAVDLGLIPGQCMEVL